MQFHIFDSLIILNGLMKFWYKLLIADHGTNLFCVKRLASMFRWCWFRKNVCVRNLVGTSTLLVIMVAMFLEHDCLGLSHGSLKS